LIFVFFNYSFGSIDTLEKGLVENSTDSIVADSINVVSNSYNFSWGIIFFILIVIIGLYIFQLYQKMTTIYQIDKKIIEDNNENNNESWGSVFNSINEQPEAKNKYDELKTKCHPDRFPKDNKKNRIATKLFAELSEHKLDLTKLKELEHRINRELY
jgi:hypothetical protein